MTKSNLSFLPNLNRQFLLQVFLVGAGLLLSVLIGRHAQTWMSPVPALFLPVLVIGLRKPVLLVHAFLIAFFAASWSGRFAGLSVMELLGFSLIGLAALRVALRLEDFPRSNLYYPIFLYSLFLTAYFLMFPEHEATQRLWTHSGYGLALYFAATVLIKSRRDITRFVAAIAIAYFVVWAYVAYMAVSLPDFDVFEFRRKEQVLAPYTTWNVNQMLPVLLLSALAFPDTKTRRLAAVGFLVAATLDVISTSRAGLIELGLILLMTASYFLVRRLSGRNRWLIVLPLVVVWVYGALSGVSVLGRTWDSLVLDFQTGTSRWHAFLDAWYHFQRYPLSGALMEFGYSIGYGHSYWGKIMDDYGLPFLLINVALVTLIIRDAYLLSRRDDDPTLSVVGKGMLISSLLAVWQMLPNSVLYSRHYTVIFWLMRGVTTACLNMPDETADGRPQAADGE